VIYEGFQQLETKSVRICKFSSGLTALVNTCVALAWKMLGRGGIRNPSFIASRTLRSRKVIGGQLEAILDPIFA